jgi:mannosyl-oligosaccharide glucosidase
MFADYARNPNTSRIEMIPHSGYISLLPLALKLIPIDSPKLDAVLTQLKDPEGVWSEHGILSLSKSDEYFGKGENYWRGPIWININYLLLDALRHYSPHNSKAASMYPELKSNLIRTIHSEYKRSGFLYEQYNPKTGQGQRSKPFTGWTSLVVLMLSEIF